MRRFHGTCDQHLYAVWHHLWRRHAAQSISKKHGRIDQHRQSAAIKAVSLRGTMLIMALSARLSCPSSAPGDIFRRRATLLFVGGETRGR